VRAARGHARIVPRAHDWIEHGRRASPERRAMRGGTSIAKGADMLFTRGLLFSLALGAGALGCHRDRDANMAGSPHPVETGGTSETATSTGAGGASSSSSVAQADPSGMPTSSPDYRDPNTAGPIGGDRGASTNGQIIEPSDPTGMATDAGVGFGPDAGMRDAGVGGSGDAGTGRSRATPGMGSGSAGSGSGSGSGY
jgi:hypothetical protein